MPVINLQYTMGQNLDIEPFLLSLNTTLTSIRDVMKIYDSKVAFEFNPINFLRPDENKHSEILAYFLDPNRKHGQGSVFLDLFLTHLEFNHLIGESVKVVCEKGIDNLRRIDILLSFGGNKFGLAIENKIGASDQGNQVSDYLDYLNKNYTDHCILYLHPYGNSPTEISIDKNKLNEALDEKKIKLISYQNDIINCLHEWSQYCQADKVRSFLNDFEQYIKHNLMGERFMNEQNIIVKQILNSPKNIEMAFSIANSINQVKKNLIPELQKTIEEIAREKNLNFKFYCEDFKIYSGFQFTRDSWRHLKIGFEFEKGDLNSLIYGIIWKTNDKPKELADSIRNVLGGKKSEGWPSYKEMDHPYRDFGCSAIPWIGLYNGELKQKIESILEDILIKFEGLDL